MKTLQKLFSFDSLWAELAVSTLFVAGFVVLGYLSREFALDLQAHFLAFGGGEWGVL